MMPCPAPQARRLLRFEATTSLIEVLDVGIPRVREQIAVGAIAGVSAVAEGSLPISDQVGGDKRGSTHGRGSRRSWEGHERNL